VGSVWGAEQYLLEWHGHFVISYDSMGIITFRVQGSATLPYTTQFNKDGSNLTALCTSAAGEAGLNFKHRIRILRGDPAGVVSTNIEDVKTVESGLLEQEIASVDNSRDQRRKLTHV
jgi:hypothetical protein